MAIGAWPRHWSWPGGAGPGSIAGSRISSPILWWQAVADSGLVADDILHQPYEIGARLPWDHLNVKKGRAFLEKEQNRANVQLAAMAGAE